MAANNQFSIEVRSQRQVVVLIVDDDEAIRRPIARLLSRSGFVVWQADCGDEALAQLRTHPRIGVVLLDQTMPNGSGPSFAARMRLENPTVRIIVHSGQTIGAADRELVDDVIQKPADISTLVALIDRWSASPAFPRA